MISRADAEAAPSGRTTVGRPVPAILRDLCRRPRTHLVERWNWKSAVLSSLVRSSLFFIANLDAGLSAARAALVTELVFRGMTAGFYGALTQAFRDATPAWTGTVTAMLVLPAVSHLLEGAVHWGRGTARLAASLALSVVFTALSTSFNLYAMRRGALTVGAGSEPLRRDIARVPLLIAGFVSDIVRAAWRGLRRR